MNKKYKKLLKRKIQFCPCQSNNKKLYKCQNKKNNNKVKINNFGNKSIITM